ncbi:hypothetical protein F6R98_03650 [Candidatus Methylospira mobilis]|uniref:Uncharacterized protein n=1 Tax=Candidatus Methylospira mobilis TaxID=1808979 RepID=A0A5Q0BDA3_9GAMM|nr:hypothetical protein [Candidatus Methylospira mobilis]QFY41835.1 hypothetical protein F6R98_03650 [Candidatus Methylospira mobilis]WNV06704.1 hypothetical protein RP726_09945 [Candidatus Methylospira mobilis]
MKIGIPLKTLLKIARQTCFSDHCIYKCRRGYNIQRVRKVIGISVFIRLDKDRKRVMPRISYNATIAAKLRFKRLTG